MERWVTMMAGRLQPRIGRRQFIAGAGKVALVGSSLPALLAACGGAEAPPRRESPGPGTSIVGDVVDFTLSSDDWPGAFGSVTLRLNEGLVNGEKVYFIRTDTSDQAFAESEGLVFAPRLSSLVPSGLTGAAYAFDGGPTGQVTVLSSGPGRDGYTPAWRIHRVSWSAGVAPRLLGSEADVRRAGRKDELTIEETNVVMNGPVVKWSTGEMPVDPELVEYLGAGQLIEPADVAAMTVTFKLHECFPQSRYIVCDTSMPPMAEGMHIVASPGLEGTSKAAATGRTNVFMNGIEGSGPMGFQPSVFDSKAGEPEWSPYWDHMTYAWMDEASARLLRSERQIVAARDGGELEEFPGTPDTNGTVFTVNCPVPVVAPNTFTG